jgi:hypothetical protein
MLLTFLPEYFKINTVSALWFLVRVANKAMLNSNVKRKA